MKTMKFSTMSFVTKSLLCFLLVLGLAHQAAAQTELAPWGNIKGIRIDGQLMEFETSLCIVRNNWKEIASTGKEKQRPKYVREGAKQTVTTAIDQLNFVKSVEDKGVGEAIVNVEARANEDVSGDGVFIAISLPSSFYAEGSARLDNGKALSLKSTSEQLASLASKPVQSLRFDSPQRTLDIKLDEPVLIVFRKGGGSGTNDLQVFIPIGKGIPAKGNAQKRSLTIKATGTPDKRPVSLQIDPGQSGRVFDGFGGNFRLQNAKTDPQVIDYCLENLRLAWGRVEMPWRFWQPEKGGNPIDSAKNGKLHPNVKNAMEMAQRLSKLGMPVILSAWSGPKWAVVGEPKFRPGPDGVWGNPLDTASTEEIYKSIGDYVQYLKDQYGVEISMFSFNESDLGINIRQTGEEHAALIKGLGAHFEQRGLKTKMLLGDNSDATTYDFIYPAMNDAETHRYIGAISFHSWRGWEKEILQKWADAATKMNLPLIVGEGSIDAQAWGYPAIFEEPTYALEEINLYVRLLNICQPASILQWQLTADYSPMVGGGIFGNNEPLRPTQRFWNLKQLASTPEAVKAIGAQSDKTDVSIAAMADQTKNICAIHLVNTGPSRTANLAGIPSGVKSFRVFITDKSREMKEGKTISVTNGKCDFTLETGTYTYLINQ